VSDIVAEKYAESHKENWKCFQLWVQAQP